MTPINVGVSLATSSAADSGHIASPFTVTGGGGGGSLMDLLLPKTSTSQTWIVYAFLGLMAVGLYLIFTRKKGS